jgi:hypothetical protein
MKREMALRLHDDTALDASCECGFFIDLAAHLANQSRYSSITTSLRSPMRLKMKTALKLS